MVLEFALRGPIVRMMMPVGAIVLGVDMKPSEPWVTLWALCPKRVQPARAPRTFVIALTGQAFDVHDGQTLQYVGTCLSKGGMALDVRHVFELVDEPPAVVDDVVH